MEKVVEGNGKMREDEKMCGSVGVMLELESKVQGLNSYCILISNWG